MFMLRARTYFGSSFKKSRLVGIWALNGHWSSNIRDTSAARLATAPSGDDAVHKQPPELIPEAYIKANRFQRNVNIRTLDLLQMSFGSAPNRSQQFIDLGCGTGDFTRQELLPRCQPCRRMVATDVSPGMVKYAKENFAHPQIAYEVHDIESDVSGLLKKYGKFERVYSFFVLNWAEDIAAALRNVAALMTDEGECLLVFPARLSFYVLWRKIVELDRWKPYKGVIERFIPSSQDIEERSALTPYMLDILESANLKPRTCEVISVDTSGEDVDEFIDVELSTDPIAPLLSEESKTLFKTDMAEIIRKMWSEKPAGDSYFFQDIFLVHASKISTRA
ncbi:acid methyltransferase, putative [Ixodes scapularis]|uniref:Acid methyltransferase, putative n=1 Tax=Ixodes scapularis TaxID=6945 RepID=B7PMP0_IXOSC|nr:acid methyltransferase, putative [Ixodes scapularis]|eukprot:XP_002435038.1 acid methyltransferase, putative [Ixodes scapularis]